MRAWFTVPVLCFSLLAFGCTTADRGDNGQSPPGGPVTPPPPDTPVGTGDAQLSGKVVAPEGTIPISGALVYLAGSPPPAIPDGVYCDKCVHLPDGTPLPRPTPMAASSGANSGERYLVVQKGAFRRVRRCRQSPVTQQVPLALTTMPAITDKANGDDVPKIAVLLGAWDPIELVLARMGLRPPSPRTCWARRRSWRKTRRRSPSTASTSRREDPYPPPVTLSDGPGGDRQVPHRVHPVLGLVQHRRRGSECPRSATACSTPIQRCIDLAASSGRAGRLYVSDWSYEYVRQVIPRLRLMAGRVAGHRQRLHGRRRRAGRVRAGPGSGRLASWRRDGASAGEGRMDRPVGVHAQMDVMPTASR